MQAAEEAESRCEMATQEQRSSSVLLRDPLNLTMVSSSSVRPALCIACAVVALVETRLRSFTAGVSTFASFFLCFAKAMTVLSAPDTRTITGSRLSWPASSPRQPTHMRNPASLLSALLDTSRHMTSVTLQSINLLRTRAECDTSSDATLARSSSVSLSVIIFSSATSKLRCAFFAPRASRTRSVQMSETTNGRVHVCVCVSE